MSVICPNMSNPDVAREFNELKAATNERAAYAIWSLNNGNGIDKAPNGAESKLFNDLLEHYGDRTKAIQAKAKTYGKSFRGWFGDWTAEDKSNVSKVVDQNGEPLVVYHGTNKIFNIFKPEKHTNSIWFTSDQKYANYYAEQSNILENIHQHHIIYPAFLNVKNPLDLRFKIYNNEIVTIDGKHFPLGASMDYELDYGKLADLIYFGEIEGHDGVFGQDKPYDKDNKSHGTEYAIFNPNQIKHVDNTGIYSEETPNIYDDYETISELNNYDQSIDAWVIDSIIKAVKEDPNASILDVAQKARKEWIENRQKEILNDTQLKLAEAYGLRQEVGEDGRIRFISDSNDEKTQLVIDFLDYISGDTQGYYDFNSKSTAAHHVIAISLTNGDPSTFSHELAHHYVRMFWRSKLIQTALRAVDKPGMSDEQREESLVDLLTSNTNDMKYMSSIESQSFLQKIWSAIATMLYNIFGIENKYIRDALFKNITRAFVVNEQQKIINSKSIVYQMADQRMYKKSAYKEKLKNARIEFRKNKSVIKYEQVGADKTQNAIKSIVQGSISRNKQYRKNNIESSKILVEMQIAEDRVRKFVDDINQYRQNYLSSINATTPTRKQKKDSVYTQEELNANIELIRGFLRQANDELHDVAEKFTSMESAQYAHYISKEIVDPVTGDTSVEYLDTSHINDPDVTVTEVDFKELSEINQNILGFYDATIKNLYNAIRSVEFKNTYGVDVQQELLSEITSVNSTANGDIRLNEMITHLKACYDDAISKRLKQFVHKYINEHAKSLSDDKREALIYSTNTWLENQNAFGDIGITEVWLGLASNSKSSLIRLMQDIIDNTTQGQNNAVLERGNRLRTLRSAAIVAVNKQWSLGDKMYGWLSPFNIDKLLMEKDDDGFTGNFITEVNEGKFYNERAAFIDKLLYSKGGIQDRLRTRLNDPKYQLEIDNKGEVVFPDGQDDLDKEYRHQVNRWMGEHAIRRFTTEYYDIRIDMLSPMTLKAQTAIQNDINDIIRACTINGKVHTELLTSTRVLELQRLYHKKSQLSNPFDEYGRRKPDGSDEATIAKELMAWNQWQSEHIKNKMDYDAYNEAKANAKDKDAFERNNTYPTINPEIWEEIARLFPNSSSATIQDLRQTRAKLISITKKKGLFKPDIDRLVDRDTGLIKPGFEEFWSNLKHYDELIEQLKNSSQTKKWTKAQQALYKSLMTQMPIMINLAGGIQESWYNHIQKAIKKRLEDKYGKYDPRVASEFAKEMEQFQYTVRGTNGQMSKKGPLSIFSITQPPAVKVNTSKGLIDAVVKEPISAYSVIDAAASDPKFVDVRFNETSGKAIQPMTDDTPGNNGVSYTNKTYKTYIEYGPKALQDYYNELMATMRESYARIPFAGEYDGRLCQQGASTGQMFHRNRWWNIGKPLLYWFKRRYSINESDTDINIDYELRPDGTRSMNIPVRYIRRLDDPREINSDVLGSVMDFYEMSLNYENKSKALPLFLTAVDKLNQTGTTRTRQKTFLKGIVNRQFYERSRNFDANEDNLMSYASTWSKRMLKWLPGLRSLTSLGLLALNWLAGIVAFIDPALQLAADAATNKYISIFDYLAGMAHVIARAPIALMSAGKSRSYDIVSSGMRKFGLSSTGAYNFHNMDRSQIRRFLQDGLTMLPFSLGEHTINAHVFASVMHSYRYNKDTKTFMNHEQYMQYAVQNGIAIKDAEWEYFKSTTLLSAYHNDREGNLVPKNNKYGAAITNELEEEIGKRMRNRTTMANYIVPSSERTKIQSNVATAFFVVMRTFMLVGIADRFKSLRDFQIPDDSPIDETVQSDTRSQYKKEYYGDKGGYNFQTGTVDDGALTAIGHMFGNLLGYMKYAWYSLKHPFRSRYDQKSRDFRDDNKISETDLYGIQRFAAEMLIVLALAAIQTLFHNKMIDDGDDDKYGYQVIDHILIRSGIVRYTWYSKDIVFDIVNTITPSKGDIDKKFKLIDLLIDSYKGFQEHGTHYEDWEKVKSGGYKNAPKALRDLLQTFSSLGLHNLYTASSIEGIKSKTKWYTQTGGVWWKGFWHDANPGKKSSGKSKKTSKKSKDPLDNLGNLNNLDNLGNLGGFDNLDNLGGL